MLYSFQSGRCKQNRLGCLEQTFVFQTGDLDLIIIQETNLPMHKKGLDIRLSLIGTSIV